MSKTSSSCEPATSSARGATPLPRTTPVSDPFVCCTICCAAASISKLTLLNFPSRCSVTRSIFILEHPRFVFQLLDQLRRNLFRLPGDEFSLFRFMRHVNLLHMLRRRVRHSERRALHCRDFFFLCRHDALQRGVARLVDSRLNREHRRKRQFDPLKPSRF